MHSSIGFAHHSGRGRLAANILGVAAIVLVGFYLRVVGIDWDEGHLLHPDERFLVMVQGAVAWVSSWQEYFASHSSTLNPHNRNFPFFVYGTFPLFLVRALYELFSNDVIPRHLIGRFVSIASDMGTLLLLMAVGAMFWGRRVSMVAGILYATCAAAIQHSHFGVVDALGTFLATAAFALAMTISSPALRSQLIVGVLVALFGVVCGLAGATKINLLLVSALLVPALLLRIPVWGGRQILQTAGTLVSAAALTLFVFRCAQPYAFSGPGLFDLGLNTRWVANMAEVSRLMEPSLHYPPSVQWIDRSRLHGVANMVVWGMGMPLGLACMLALAYGIRKVVLSRDRTLLVPVLWGALALVVYGILPKNPAMRYPLPSYPVLILLAAWFVSLPYGIRPLRAGSRFLLRLPAALVIGLTPCWGFAFSSIYHERHPRVAASEWIIDHVPAALNLLSPSGAAGHVPVPLGQAAVIPAGTAKQLGFSVPRKTIVDGLLAVISVEGERGAKINVSVQNDSGKQVLGSQDLELQSGSRVIAFESSYELEPGRMYRLLFRVLQDSQAGLTIRKPRVAHETSWDDPLPLRVKGYDPYGGLYEGDLKLEMYWPDNMEKLRKISQALEQADYLFITSNRQWGSVGRLPKQYPLSQNFYRALLGCDQLADLLRCYAEAQSGKSAGVLGFRLAKTFESYPGLFGLSFNNQLADEALTVYDHPKVMIFAKDRQISAQALSSLISNPYARRKEQN